MHVCEVGLVLILMYLKTTFLLGGHLTCVQHLKQAKGKTFTFSGKILHLFYHSDLELLANIQPMSLDASRVEDMVKDYFSKVEPVSFTLAVLYKLCTSFFLRFVCKFSTVSIHGYRKSAILDL